MVSAHEEFAMKAIVFLLSFMSIGFSQSFNMFGENPLQTYAHKVSLLNQSFRGRPFSNEEKSIIKMVPVNTNKTRCTGAFVKNSKNMFIVSLAAHCFGKEEISKERCRSYNYIAAGGKIGECGNVLLSKHDSEAVLIEVWFDDQALPEVKPLALADFDVEKSTRIYVPGFPGDEFNQNDSLLVSRNCWVSALPTPIQKYSLTNMSEFQKIGDDVDEWVLHTCSTEHGNSGGPVILEGTDIALGYISATSTTQGIESASKDNNVFNSWKSVIRYNRPLFESFGISIVTTKPDFTTSLRSYDYLKVIDQAALYVYKGRIGFQVTDVNTTNGTIQLQWYDNKGILAKEQLQCGTFPDKSCINPNQNVSAEKKAAITIYSTETIINDNNLVNSNALLFKRQAVSPASVHSK